MGSQIKFYIIRVMNINPNTKTGRIYLIAFDLLEKNPDGIQWSKLNTLIKETDPTLHPKTINGCVWKLIEKFPDKIYKPSKGLFRLKNIRNRGKPTIVFTIYTIPK
jgi:hypothetical protein